MLINTELVQGGVSCLPHEGAVCFLLVAMRNVSLLTSGLEHADAQQNGTEQPGAGRPGHYAEWQTPSGMQLDGKTERKGSFDHAAEIVAAAATEAAAAAAAAVVSAAGMKIREHMDALSAAHNGVLPVREATAPVL